jgi:hypothetical protein
MSYFQDIVLPSVNLPYKPTYNITEVCKILDCHYSTVASYVQKGSLKITLNRRIYAQELDRFFEQSHSMGTRASK